MTNDTHLVARLLCRTFGVVLILIGLFLGGGGLKLAMLGGSLYYLLAGAALLAAGYAYLRLRPAGFYIYAGLFLATLAWALWEAGFRFWPLVPRIVAPAVLALAACLLAPLFPALRPYRVAARAAGILILAGLGAMGYLAFQPHGVTRNGTATALNRVPAAAGEWRAYGHTLAGDRHVAIDQINKENVDRLEVAWTFRTGVRLTKAAADSNTPIQVGDTLYACTAFNKLFAIDAETGKERWSYDAKASAPRQQRCRGVAYYEARTANGPCATRIVMNTIDARLIAVDARTGALCAQFGKGGQVDLREGMGEVKDGFYFQTSTPAVTRGLVIVGGRIADNQEVGEPSGVVRAFSAETGELVWAWDIGPRSESGEKGEYTRGTPNVWTAAAVDEELGIIYLPTGNATPDHWGAHRSAASDRYGSALVALDVETGREVWRYQMVHHDIWDYDNPSQPSLYDVPDGRGGRIPAVIQMTKQGQIFVLDRRTGRPITRVEERPVPKGNALGERYAPTQPFSVGMPMIGADRLTEADMWGATPIDQLLCRIGFRSLRYDGAFTPPGSDASFFWPGYFGGMNWGGATLDPARDYMIFNDIRVGQKLQLIPREMPFEKQGTNYAAQEGTPYGVIRPNFMSILGVPCNTPPYGTMTAIDLRTRKIAWQVPLGTVEDTGPLGIPMGLPIPIGMPTLGGPVSTAGGITFYAGTQDFYLRALDSDTGRELWKGRLPVGANATPMTYVSPRSGKQFVVISAGGARESPQIGDYIVAYKLRD